MEYDLMREYGEVYQRRLRVLADKVDRLVDESAHSQIIVQTKEDGELAITQSSIQPEDFLDDGASVEESEELANTHNNNLLAVARLSINSVLTSISLKHAVSVVARGDLDVSTQTSSNLLHYGGAQFKKLRLGRDDLDVSLSRVRLEGVEHFSRVEEYNVRVTDEQLLKILTMQFTTTELSSVKFMVGPTVDELLYEGIMLLGVEKFSKLFPAISGRFRSENELDKALGEMWLDFYGTSKEVEMLPFLDKVRLRAVAARDNTRLNVKHDIDRPTLDQLKEFERLFD